MIWILVDNNKHMENIEQYKEELHAAYAKLSRERMTDLEVYYDTKYVAPRMIRDARASAQDVIDYADRHDYGYGEVGYNLNEDLKDFSEEVPELEKQWERIQHAYFNYLVEAKSI